MTRLPLILTLVASACCNFAACTNRQSETERRPVRRDSVLTEDVYYNRAYWIISDMLSGKAPLSLKKAVFAYEWAYSEGKLNYEDYDKEITETAQRLQRFIKKKGVSHLKTAGNYALFEYSTKPSELNGNKAFEYDFEDPHGKEDQTKQFVTKLMQTHTGQCHSLPLLYKIIADEMRTEAYIAYAPLHSYIKHRDEIGEWVNVELTTGRVVADEFYISTYDVTTDDIRNRIYMDTISLHKTIADCLVSMAFGYKEIYGVEDPFLLECYNVVLKYYPDDINALKGVYAYTRAIDKRYYVNHDKRNLEYVKTFIEIDRKLDSMHYKDMTPELYQELSDAVEAYHRRILKERKETRK